MVRVTVEGNPVWLRPQNVIAVGTGYRDVPQEGSEPLREPVTMLTVKHLGQLPVDQTVEEVLSALGVSVEPQSFTVSMPG